MPWVELIQTRQQDSLSKLIYFKLQLSKSSSAKKPGKRGRKPAKIDTKAKLERSRQSARECRARKKLRYQYLEELVASREKAITQLRSELDLVSKVCLNADTNITRNLFEMNTTICIDYVNE